MRHLGRSTLCAQRKGGFSPLPFAAVAQRKRVAVAGHARWPRCLAHILPARTLLVYYAGHGQFDREGKKSYWLPSMRTQMTTRTGSWRRKSPVSRDAAGAAPLCLFLRAPQVSIHRLVPPLKEMASSIPTPRACAPLAPLSWKVAECLLEAGNDSYHRAIPEDGHWRVRPLYVRWV